MEGLSEKLLNEQVSTLSPELIELLTNMINSCIDKRLVPLQAEQSDMEEMPDSQSGEY